MGKCSVALFFGVFYSFTIYAKLPSYVPKDGLIGWWGFNGNGNDDSGNGYHATIKNGFLSPDRNGNVNGAYAFKSNVNSSLSLPIPNIENTFTISIWAKANKSAQNAITTGACYPAVSVGLATASQNWLLKPSYGGSSGQAYGVGISFGTDRIIIAEHTKNFLDARILSQRYRTDFVHIVLVYTTTQIRLYINGNLMDSQTMHCKGVTKRLSKTFAEELYSSLFSGVIDDIGIWNRALIGNEVTNLYKGEELVSEETNLNYINKNNDGSYSEKRIFQICSNQKYALNYFDLNKFAFESSKIIIKGDIVDDFFNGEGLMQTVFHYSKNPTEVNKVGNGVLEKIYSGHYLFSHQGNPAQSIEGRVKVYYEEKSNDIIAVVFGIKGKCSYQVLFK